jgi:prepilin-type processing-associated H-X9-DG protein
MRVEVFLCPSDPHARGADFGGTNYRGNLGTHPTWGCHPTVPGPTDPIGGDGFFYGVRAKQQPGGRGADVRDGLSNTVAFAERLVGTGARAPYPEGNYFTAGPIETGGGCWTRDDWIRRCRAITRDHPDVNMQMGHWWLYAGYDNTFYNHILAPNSPTPDCGEQYSGVVTARSWHRGGVNVAMADGQARFVSERISLEAWRALGSRASGDLVDAETF